MFWNTTPTVHDFAPTAACMRAERGAPYPPPERSTSRHSGSALCPRPKEILSARPRPAAGGPPGSTTHPRKAPRSGRCGRRYRSTTCGPCIQRCPTTGSPPVLPPPRARVGLPRRPVPGGDGPAGPGDAVGTGHTARPPAGAGRGRRASPGARLLQELRFLLNYHLDSTPPVVLIFCGHMELRHKLALYPPGAIRQRVAVAYHPPAHTVRYLTHQLAQGGVTRPRPSRTPPKRCGRAACPAG
jgi:hypothetical protein